MFARIGVMPYLVTSAMYRYFLFSKRVVLERMSRLFAIHRGCEDIMKTKLPWEYVLEKTSSMVSILMVWKSIQSVLVR